jgi:hypothetical protein
MRVNHVFKKAERKSAKLRAAFCGTSGSGKTYSALLLARGLSDKVAVIDTERGSSELYADLFGFDVAQLAPPFTPQRYIELIRVAATQYDVLVIDSLSHAWAGEGGVLEMHDNATRSDRSGNSYTAWRNVTPQHNALVDAVLNAPCHVVCTMRSKAAYELVDDGKGKKKPVKIGLAPIQRDGIDYEFTLVFDLSVDGNIATASKDRTNLWRGRNEIISDIHGRELREWLESGKSAPDYPVPPAQPEPQYDFEAAERTINGFDDDGLLAQWLAQERIKNGWKKTDHPHYVTVKAVCAERVNAIREARKSTEETKEPA